MSGIGDARNFHRGKAAGRADARREADAKRRRLKADLLEALSFVHAKGCLCQAVVFYRDGVRDGLARARKIVRELL